MGRKRPEDLPDAFLDNRKFFLIFSEKTVYNKRFSCYNTFSNREAATFDRLLTILHFYESEAYLC